MRVWRVCRRAHASNPLSGRGGALFAGRWHSRGRPVVYAAGSLSLAVLETLVHVPRELAPADLVQVEIHVPDDLPLTSIAATTLPRRWRRYPAPEALRRVGDAWIEEARTAILAVPSAVIPEERVFLLNPAHPDAARFAVVAKRGLRLDSRFSS